MTEQAITDRPFTAASFQAYMDEGKLMGSRNRETGEVFVPPRPIDPATHGEAMEWVELSGRGTLAAFTSVYIGTTAMIDAGYEQFAERFHPILDVFGDCGVRFALEVHPTEIAFDTASSMVVTVNKSPTSWPISSARGSSWL